MPTKENNIENPQPQKTQQQAPSQPQMPPQGSMMVPPMMPGQAMGGQPIAQPMPRGWRERMMRRFGMDMHAQVRKGERTIPDWMMGKPLASFFVSLFACWIAFGHVPAFDLVMAACISVVLFFYGGYTMSRAWAKNKEKVFLKHVFVVGVIVRLLWAFYSYFFFNPDHYSHAYGDGADSGWYIAFGKDLARWISGESKYSLSEIIDIDEAAIDDTGYPMWLGIIYFLTGAVSDAVIPFMFKSMLGAYCAISIYHVANRHFGEGVARMSAIFMALNPNMVYWCGTMMKEAEMVFLVCLAVDNFDRVLSSGKRYTFKALLPGLLAGLALMFMRTALGLVVFLAVFAHIIMSSRRVMSVGKKILAGVLVAAVLLIAMGDRIRTQSEELLKSAQSSEKLEQNREYRAHREGGNAFAKYATAAVFAPLIFTIPFPTYNAAQEGQLVQVQLAGGSYIKNILSFFVILVMMLLLISGEWRQHVFIITYTVGYHMVLVLSNFAHSGRFHMPVWPMLMLFAAYGIQMAKGNKKLQRGFTWALVLEVVICLAWNWFKLKGRGMI